MIRVCRGAATALAVSFTGLLVAGCVDTSQRGPGFFQEDYYTTRYVKTPLDSGHGDEDYWRHRRGHSWRDGNRDGDCRTPACRPGNRHSMDDHDRDHRDHDRDNHGKGGGSKGDKGKGDNAKDGGKDRNS